MTKVIKLIVTFVFISSGAWCQNLVKNPSFEEGNNYCHPIPWATIYDSYVFLWECPTTGTADVFSKDFGNQSCWSAMPGIPSSVYVRIGSQMPRSQSRFAGIYTYSANNYREYLHTELSSPLEVGHSYCAEMYVSLADRVHKAANNLGMHFSVSRIRDYTISEVLHVAPQVLEKTIIQDSLSWVKISGAFKATEPFKYLTIGNFFTSENTDAIHQPGRGSSFVDRAYYFIDDVSVTSLSKDPFVYSGSTTICEGKSASLSITGSVEDVKWTTLDDTATVLKTGNVFTATPTTTTRYRVTGKNCKVLIKDTIEITVRPFVKPNLGKDTTICEGTSILLSPGEYSGYTWNDQSSNPKLIATSAGVYSVSVTNQFGCTGNDEIEISLQSPPQIELGEDVVVCDKFPTLEAGSPELTYLWSTGENESSIQAETQGKYWVRAENDCGVTSDTIRIYSFEDVFIPNVITPNSDTKNELFQIQGIPPSIKPTLKILSRSGKEIFFETNYSGNWPSPFEQESLPSGIYYYLVTIPACQSYRGWLHILR